MVMHYLVGKSFVNARFAKKKIALVRILFHFGTQMMIMIPVFAFIALDHEFVHFTDSVRFFTVAIAIEEILSVIVLLVLIIVFVFIETAREGHSSVTTVTSETYSCV